MAFCIRNSLHYINENWQTRADVALESVIAVTKAFNNGETLGYCKARIESVTAIGLSQKAQMYLYMASQTNRKKDFSQAAFRALESQREFIKELGAKK